MRSFYFILKGDHGVLRLPIVCHSLFGLRLGVEFFLDLMRRGYSMAGWCCMCWSAGETVDHLLLHCNLVSHLWRFILRFFGIQWVLAEKVVDSLFRWRNRFGKHMSGVWNLVPLCLMWTIWKERNSRIFEDKASSMDQLMGSFVNELFDWSRIWGLTTATIVTDFVDSLGSMPSFSTL